MNVLKWAGTAILILMLILNIVRAINYYYMDTMHLSNSFYFQSLNNKVIDNKIEKKQLYGLGYISEGTSSLVVDSGKFKIQYEIKKTSYRTDWQ